MSQPDPNPRLLRSLAPAAVTLLRVRGEDAFSYLQSQVSADLRSEHGQRARYTLWLDAKGYVLADSFILQEAPESFLLFSYTTAEADLRRIVETNIIADDVEIESIGEGYRHWALWADAALPTETLAQGQQADSAPPPAVEAAAFASALCTDDFKQVGAAGRAAAIWLAPACESLPAGQPALLFGGRNAAAANFDLLLPATAPEPAWLDAFCQVPWAQRESRRIADGIPAVPADSGERDMPQESGDLIRIAVSTSKGCYLGQEVIAHWHATQQVRSGLFRIRAGAEGIAAIAAALSAGVAVGTAAEAGAADAGVADAAAPLRLYAGKKPVGQLRSFCLQTGAGLASLRIHRLGAVRELSVQAEGAAVIRVCEPMLA